MQLRDLALRQGDDLHVAVRHALEQAGDIFLIARKAVHRFGEHNLEATAHCIGDHRLDAWTEERCARDRVIRIFLDDVPALALGVRAANAELIGNRGIALRVARVSGVEGYLHEGSPAFRQEASPAPSFSESAMYRCAAQRARARTNSIKRSSVSAEARRSNPSSVVGACSLTAGRGGRMGLARCLTARCPPFRPTHSLLFAPQRVFPDSLIRMIGR